MKKLFKTLAILTCLVGFHTSANAAPANSSLSSIQECTGGVHPANNSFCRSTPEKYETTIYEMGLCSSHPFDDGVVTTELLHETRIHFLILFRLLKHRHTTTSGPDQFAICLARIPSFPRQKGHVEGAIVVTESRFQ